MMRARRGRLRKQAALPARCGGLAQNDGDYSLIPMLVDQKNLFGVLADNRAAQDPVLAAVALAA